jgi:KaiC/GvpD/RAD55 family RecA-like ATPase
MDEYRALLKVSTFDELASSGATIIERITVDDLLAERADGGDLIQLLPRVINNRLDGGVLPGHHVTVFGRPEIGKSMAVISIASGIARQGFKVLHIENEDRPRDVTMRYINSLSGMTRHEVLADPRRAQILADQNGLGQVSVVELTPGGPGQLVELVDRYSPSVVIVNQMRNLNVGENNKVVALEKAAIACRNLAKTGNCVVISVTQAGDSADNKRFLEMGDVDFSNTGIPSQCDVMIGIGADESMLRMGERGISFPKNKVGVGGDSHDPVIVRARNEISRITSPTASGAQPEGS